MKEIIEEKNGAGAAENRKIGKLFYRLGVLQILQIAAGAIVSFFVAPASLFVSRTESEAFAWLAAGFAGFVIIALGIISAALSIVAAIAFRREKGWRDVVGIFTAGVAMFAFPLGTIAGGVLLRRIFKARK